MADYEDPDDIIERQIAEFEPEVDDRIAIDDEDFETASRHCFQISDSRIQPPPLAVDTHAEPAYKLDLDRIGFNFTALRALT